MREATAFWQPNKDRLPPSRCFREPLPARLQFFFLDHLTRALLFRGIIIFVSFRFVSLGLMPGDPS